jgi:hypothetical protein
MTTPHANHCVTSLPRQEGLVSLGVARRETRTLTPHAHHCVISLPLQEGLVSLGAARRETCS